LLERRGQRIGIVGRDHNGAHVLRGQVVDPGDLLGRAGRRWPHLFERTVQFAGGLLSSTGSCVEVRVVDGLGEKHNIEIAPAAGSTSGASAGTASTGCQQQQDKNQKTSSECLKQFLHCLLLYTFFALPAASRR